MKRQYFAYLAGAQCHSEQSIDAVAKAISRFEAYTRYISSSQGLQARSCQPPATAAVSR
jgi:hypothetical protein